MGKRWRERAFVPNAIPNPHSSSADRPSAPAAAATGGTTPSVDSDFGDSWPSVVAAVGSSGGRPEAADMPKGVEIA